MAGERKSVGGGHGRPHRMMSVWTALHDNGWQTSVVENPNGSFAAWAAPEGESGGIYTILEGAEDGKAAALDSLRREAGHSRCSNGCSEWALRTFAVFDRRQGVGRPSKSSFATGRKRPAARKIA